MKDLAEINKYDYIVRRGDTFEPLPIEITFTDFGGNFISDLDLSGYTGLMEVKADASSAIQYTFTTDNGSMTFTDNIIELYMQQIDTVGDYVYDLQITDGTKVFTIQSGKFIVHQDITNNGQ